MHDLSSIINNSSNLILNILLLTGIIIFTFVEITASTKPFRKIFWASLLLLSFQLIPTAPIGKLERGALIEITWPSFLAGLLVMLVGAYFSRESIRNK